ncbi:MAG: dynamin family protein, partial [Pseudomonadota bacterium]
DLSPEAAKAIASYDRPLLITVMGEFSSGKSTFVNAFLGAEVAPAGITPTTATLNVVKYGQTKAGRIVYLDDRVRDLPWEAVPGVLRSLDQSETRLIRHVEILYPLEALEQVNIVDTPGLNSILPEHEATARRFVSEADAVVWLFAALQAGKATEHEALEQIRREGKRVLGVVNKIDQVTAGELTSVVEELDKGLGHLVDGFLPVSARRALRARLDQDHAALVAACWPALESALEERFLGQARLLKRQAIAKRIDGLLETGRKRAVAAAEVFGQRVEVLRQAAAATRTAARTLVADVVAQESRRLSERVATAYRNAAREVLDLVEPRRLPFGSHRATPADRDYLLRLLERSLVEALKPTRHCIAEELSRTIGRASAAAETTGVSAEAIGRLEDSIALLEARVFDRCHAFLRGYLRGGRLDDFFTKVLPHLELSEDAVYHALIRDAPSLDTELAEPLAAQAQDVLRGTAEWLEKLAVSTDLDRFQTESILLVLLDYFAAELARLTKNLQGAGDQV